MLPGLFCHRTHSISWIGMFVSYRAVASDHPSGCCGLWNGAAQDPGHVFALIDDSDYMSLTWYSLDSASGNSPHKRCGRVKEAFGTNRRHTPTDRDYSQRCNARHCRPLQTNHHQLRFKLVVQAAPTTNWYLAPPGGAVLCRKCFRGKKTTWQKSYLVPGQWPTIDPCVQMRLPYCVCVATLVELVDMHTCGCLPLCNAQT